MNINLYLFNFFHKWAAKSPILDFTGIFIAKYLGFILVIAALIFLWRIKNRKERMFAAIFIVLCLILSRVIIVEFLRLFIYSPRPFAVLNFQPLINHAANNSFPSGHTSFYFALALAIFHLNRRWGAVFLASALLIGIARIFVGVHWSFDIFGGIIAAIISFVIVNLFLKKLLKK